MLVERLRRLIVWSLALTLAVGLVTHSARAEFVGKGSVMIAAGMAADVAPDMAKCDGCAGNDRALMTTACAAFCGSLGASAIISVAAEVLLDTMGPRKGSAAKGYLSPPDPYPPRSTVLS